MLTITMNSIIIGSVFIVIIILCTIGIVFASIFQSKKEKKYNECLNIIKEKGDMRFEVKNGLSKEEINEIDSEVDVDKLMKSLYNTFLSFVNKIKNNDNKLGNILSGLIKDIYIKKIDTFKQGGYIKVKDKIDLIGYSITEFDKTKLKFRITINCYDYKLLNNNIVSGSNLIKLEEVFLVTYEKKGKKWYITNYEQIYKKKLSD